MRAAASGSWKEKLKGEWNGEVKGMVRYMLGGLGGWWVVEVRKGVLGLMEGRGEESERERR